MDVIIIIRGYTSDSTLYQFQQLYMSWSQSPQFTDAPHQTTLVGTMRNYWRLLQNDDRLHLGTEDVVRLRLLLLLIGFVSEPG